MASFDYGQKIAAQTLVPAQAWDGGSDITSSAADTSGFEGLAVLVQTGTVAAGADIGIAFHEGDEDDFTPEEANMIPDNRIILSPDMDAEDDTAYIHSIVPGNHRYVRVVISRDGTDAAALSASAILGYAANVPTE